MRLSNQVGIRSKEQDFAGSVDCGQQLVDLVHGCRFKFGQRQHVPWDDDWRGCCSGGRADLGNLVYEGLGEVVGTELVGGRL